MTLVPAILALLGAKAWWMPRWLDRILPKLDVEGEAVEREVHLTDWPAEPAMAIAADDLGTLTATDAEQPVFRDVSLRLGYGGTLLVTGESSTTRTLLLALSGRLSKIEGKLRVDGSSCPNAPGAVRARVGVALLEDPRTAAAEVSDAVAGGSRIVVISDIDRLEADAAADVAQVLRRAASDLRERQDDATSPFTLVVSARDEPRASPCSPRRSAPTWHPSPSRPRDAVRRPRRPKPSPISPRCSHDSPPSSAPAHVAPSPGSP